MTPKAMFRKLRSAAAAGLTALVVLTSCLGTTADEIEFDDGSGSSSAPSSGIDAGDDTPSSGIDAGDGKNTGSDLLIVDTGEDVEVTAGIPMDTLQDAIDSGDTDALEKIASIGALTGKEDTSSKKGGSGIDSGGARRSMEDEEDPYEEAYEDLNLDEGDADEVQTEEIDERPGQLTPASTARVQEHLDVLCAEDTPTGSEAELTAASYIERILSGYGYTVQEQAFHEGVLNEDGVDAPGVNVLAERGANSQKNRKSDILLVVTHYDSKRSPSEEDPFANDKSGAAALIEAAGIVSQVVTDTDICFLFLSGQEDGGYGAQNFIAGLSEANRARIVGVLAVERVGYDLNTPYVLKTLSGEANGLSGRLQELGLMNDAHQALTHANEPLSSDDEDGVWVSVGQSSDGYIDEDAAAQIAAAQNGEDVTDENAIAIDSDVFLDDASGGGESADGSDDSSADPALRLPTSWSYLKDSASAQAAFAQVPFTAVTVSQYMPMLDADSYEETISLGLADTTAEEIALTQEGTQQETAAPEDASSSDAVPADAISSEDDLSVQGGSDEYPMVVASRVANTADIIAAALAQIMDPTS